MEDRDLMRLASRLAREAGQVILTVRAGGHTVMHKADDTPVTEADRAAEALIVEALRRIAPGIPVVAEEEISAGHVPDLRDTYWLVDPLDGTREFAAGRDEYAVCIGLVREGAAVLGAVHLPATDETFSGIVGLGAWKRDQSGERPIRVRSPPAEGLTVFASRHYATDPRIAAALHGQKIARLVNAGSALKFVRVAEGAADFYPRFNPTMEWDTAAPQAVVEAAGGRVLVEDGSPLRYGKPGWENPGFMCHGGGPA